jgi:hypothetical protein
MEKLHQSHCTAFEGDRRIASGDLAVVAAQSKQAVDRRGHAPIHIFNDESGEAVEVDFRGSVEEVVQRLSGTSEDEPPRGPGRPRMGVVAREVTLLPRHWEWLNAQPGGASVALRKLVEAARKVKPSKDRIRRSQEAAYRFATVMAGNLPGFEEALRSLFARDEGRFDEHVGSWPADVRDHVKKLAATAFHDES